MPSPTDFRRAFGLEHGCPLLSSSSQDAKTKKEGDPLDAIRIADLHVGHDVITTYERYEFPTLLRIVADTSTTQSSMSTSSRHDAQRCILERLQNDHSGTHIVYSNYGSPYECTLDSNKWRVTAITNDSSSSTTVLTFQCTNRGVAVRRRDIASLKANDTNDETEIQAAKAHLQKLGGYRVLKSHFASGRCVHCGQQFLPGALIAQNQKDNSNDNKSKGWAHVTCASKAVTSRGGRRTFDRKDKTKSSDETKTTRLGKRKAPARYNLRPRGNSGSKKKTK